MRVAFRTDASLRMGNGHVMRCLTLAHKLRSAGNSVHFICRERTGHLIGKIQTNGFGCTTLPFHPEIDQEAPEHLSAYWQLDAQETLAALHGPVDWLVVDHYGLDIQWETALQALRAHLLVIDDLANRAHACQLLVDHNLGRVTQDYEPWIAAPCRLLLGSSYALIKDEFSYQPRLQSSESTPPTSRTVVISMGGVDNGNLTEKILNALATFEDVTHLEIRVILGPHSPWNSEIAAQASHFSVPIEIYIDPPSVAALVRDADIAIGTCGVSAIERCSLRIPSINFVVAQNQLASGLALEQLGACHLIQANTLWHADFMAAFAKLCDAKDWLAMHSACATMVDGQGTQKIVEAMTHG